MNGDQPFALGDGQKDIAVGDWRQEECRRKIADRAGFRHTNPGGRATAFMNELAELIRREIKQGGDLSYARFMELALYHAQWGYYERPAEVAPGQQGDFYTSVSVGPLFGQMLAFQFAADLASLGGKCQIVEAGAHDGRLARDILTWLDRQRPDLRVAVEYWLLEPSPRRRQLQEVLLAEFGGRVRWFDSWSAVPSSGVRGVIFGNELLDAFPVHRLAWNARSRVWEELGVTVAGPGDGFTWKRLAPRLANGESHPLAPVLPEALLDVLPDGFLTEAGLAAAAWWRQAAGALSAGQLLTLDYGLTREEFFTPERGRGTTRAYRRHQVTADLLADPGGQDLTAQVNFSAVREAGEAAGLRTTTWVSQAQFLTAILSRILAARESFGDWGSAQNRQFQTLTHPEHLGRPFRVLAQSRS